MTTKTSTKSLTFGDIMSLYKDGKISLDTELKLQTASGLPSAITGATYNSSIGSALQSDVLICESSHEVPNIKIDKEETPTIEKTGKKSKSQQFMEDYGLIRANFHAWYNGQKNKKFKKKAKDLSKSQLDIMVKEYGNAKNYK